MRNLFFRVALAIGFAGVSTASIANTVMASKSGTSSWVHPDCSSTSKNSTDRGGKTYTTNTISCYGSPVLTTTFLNMSANPTPDFVANLDPQFYDVFPGPSGTYPVNSFNFTLHKREKITGFPKPIKVVVPGVSFGPSQQSSFPFRVLNASAGLTYQFRQSVAGSPGTPQPYDSTAPQPLPIGTLDSQSGMTVTTLYTDVSKLDLRVSRDIVLIIFNSAGKIITAGSAKAGSASINEHHHALNAFYINRAGQNVVDYRYAFNTSGKVRAAGNLFTSEMANIRSKADNHGNPGLTCNVGTIPCGSFDVTGGWFDAGDQGKYVQNAAVSLWHLFNLIEKDMPFLKSNPNDTSPTANMQRNIWREGNYNTIPANPDALTPGSTFNAPLTSATELPNIVKEARYEMEWLLKMQINNSDMTMSLPAGNQDKAYVDANGFGVKPVSVKAYQYNNYLQIPSGFVSGNTLYDPGTNTPVSLYRQVLKYTDNIKVDGMVFHSVHDDDWTDIPMLPQNNTKKRVLEYPTSAATLSFAAVAAQCYRVFKAVDSSFANKCWEASSNAFKAAKVNYSETLNGVTSNKSDYVYFYGEFSNAKSAPLPSIVKGAGAYADLRLNDLIYWANMERYLTTVDINQQETADARNYLRNINALPTSGDSGIAPHVKSDFALRFPIKSANWLLAYNWSNVAALGSLSAITVNPEKFAQAKVTFIDDETGTTSDIDSPATNLINYVNNKLVPFALNNPWGLPLSKKVLGEDKDFEFEWGSNHEIINAGILVAAAIRLDSIDQGVNLPRLKPEAKAIPRSIAYYMLGGNPLGISMVTRGGDGYNIHHRTFAKQADSSTIATPAGWLVGGANGQLIQSVLSAGRTPFPGEIDDEVFNGGTIKETGGSLGGYKQLMDVLPRCREADGTIRSSMCYSNNYWSYHTNEVAINWQASWLWLSSFVRR